MVLEYLTNDLLISVKLNYMHKTDENEYCLQLLQY